MMLNTLNPLVKTHGNHAQDQDAGDYQVKLEYLAAINNQVTQAPSGSQKFPDDDSHQCQTDIDLGGTEHNGDGARQDYLAKSVSLMAPKGVDQSDLLTIYLLETSVKADDGAEQSHGYSGYHDGGAAGSQPHDERGAKADFGKLFKITR